MYYFRRAQPHLAGYPRLVSHYDRLRYLDALDGDCDYDRVTRQHREFCDYLLMGLPDNVARGEDQRASDQLQGQPDGQDRALPGYFTIDNVSV